MNEVRTGLLRQALICAVFLIVAFCAAPQPALAVEACARAAVGSVVAPPQDLYSSKGQLSVAFKYETSTDKAGHTRFCFVTPQGQESPTLHVNPGDTLHVTLTNALAPPSASAPQAVMSDASNRCGSRVMTLNSVNIHFHGTNTSPTCHSDEVIHTLVNSGETFTYTLKIPADEPPGLYWYHPHVHGISEAALLGGASGAIEVEGIANFQPPVKSLPQRYLIIRDQLTTNAQVVNGPPLPAWDVSLNYVPVLYPSYKPAIIKMVAGRREFWRVVNASAGTIIDLQLLYGGKPQPMQIVALDGVPLGSQDKPQHATTETKTDILLPPAARAEFIVTSPVAAGHDAMLVTRAVNTGPVGDLDPARPLARIKTSGAFGELPPTPTQESAPNPQRFEGLVDAKVTATRKIYFSELIIPGTNGVGRLRRDDDGSARFYITVDGQRPEVFSPDNPPAITTRQGSVEDWTIENRSGEVHAFHIHQIHFLLLAVNGVPVPKAEQQFYDTYPIDFWKKGSYPSITVRMDFRGPVVGDFVYHCHILEHEDGGMMAIIRVLPHSASLTNRAAGNEPPWRVTLDGLYRRLMAWRTPRRVDSGDTRVAGNPNWTFPAKCLVRLTR
jgi:FtsP/CotA-like multicopper oxidase with cupredoxin domain